MAKQIVMIPVSSSNIQAYGYDAETETLQIAFLSGDVYQYFHVPVAIVHEFDRRNTAKESIGQWHAQAVKGPLKYFPIYSYKKVS
jgi:hypothetical protein